jgi:molybdate transport system regulatory protein
MRGKKKTDTPRPFGGIMKVRTKVWINDDKGQVIFGAGRERMLETIHRLGSMNKAARELKMSYRALWGRIKSTEDRLGEKILDTHPGGGKEGGSVLTPAGKRLLVAYKQLRANVLVLADKEYEKIFLERNTDEA